MKTLQNDFTTSEQSNRLLALGVPLNSANCIRVVRTNMVFFMQDGRITEDYLSLYNSARGEKAEPCWSVVRLLEIYMIIRGCNAFEYTFNINRNHMEDIVKMYEKTKNLLDFSKLEE